MVWKIALGVVLGFLGICALIVIVETMNLSHRVEQCEAVLRQGASVDTVGLYNKYCDDRVLAIVSKE